MSCELDKMDRRKGNLEENAKQTQELMDTKATFKISFVLQKWSLYPINIIIKDHKSYCAHESPDLFSYFAAIDI